MIQSHLDHPWRRRVAAPQVEAEKADSLRRNRTTIRMPSRRGLTSSCATEAEYRPLPACSARNSASSSTDLLLTTGA